MQLTESELDVLKYPIGKHVKKEHYSVEEIKELINQIREFPVELMKLSANLTPEDFEVSYRPGGWKVAQIIHHIADSHINAYIRLKFSLSETNPTMKGYDENIWAVMPDATSGEDAHVSIIIISGIHHRLAKVLNSLDEQGLQRTYFHTEYQKTFTLTELVALYAWHGAHHLAQIKVALEKRF